PLRLNGEIRPLYPRSHEPARGWRHLRIAARCPRPARTSIRRLAGDLSNLELYRDPMKIKTITSFALRVPLGAMTFYSSQAAFPERSSYLVRVETDTGIVGWGEGGQYGPSEPVASCVDNVLAPRLIGRDPTEPARLWEDMYVFSRDF